MSLPSQAPARSAAQKVFICYRREETAAHAGRLYDAMVARFGEGNVFMDVELAPGVDFVERITEVVSGCVALIVVMGPNWATAEDGAGVRRLDDPADFVRLEVETGLAHAEVTPIPVLVGGARMPRPEDLPAQLRPLTRRNAQEMSDLRWSYDAGRLVSTLDELLPDAAPLPDPESPPPPLAPRRSPALALQLALEGTLVAGLTAFVGRLLAEGVLEFKEAADDESDREMINHVLTEVARRTETLALAGLAVAIWLALRVARRDTTRAALRGLWLGALAGAVGGLIWSLPMYLQPHKLNFDERTLLDLGATAVAGGIFGGLIGSLWRPARPLPAGFAGALGGIAFQGYVLLAEWKLRTDDDRALAAGLATAAVVLAALATMLLLDRAGASGRASSRAP